MAKKTKLPNLTIKPIEEDIVEEEPEKELENPFVEETKKVEEKEQEKVEEKKDDVPVVEEKDDVPVKEPVKESKSSDLSDIQLKMMTNKKLKELCKAKGLRGYSSMKKSDLLRILGVHEEKKKKTEKKIIEDSEDSEEMKTHIPDSPNVIEPEDVKITAEPDPQLDEKLELEVETDIDEPKEEIKPVKKVVKKTVKKEVPTKEIAKVTRKKRMTEKQIEEKTEKIREIIKSRKQLREEKRQKDYNPFKSHYNII